MARRQKLTVLTRKRTVIDEYVHGNGGLIVGHFERKGASIRAHQNRGLALFDLTAEDPADPDAPDKIVVIQHGHQHLKRLIGVGDRRGNVFNDFLE